MAVYPRSRDRREETRIFFLPRWPDPAAYFGFFEVKSVHGCVGPWTLMGEILAVDLQVCPLLRTHKTESVHTL